jgi:amino acid permease
MRVLFLMGDWGEGLAILILVAFFITLVPFVVLIGRLWSQRIDQQLDREWNEQKAHAAARARSRLWLLLLAWLLVSVVLWMALRYLVG